ncbi:MAG: methyltransferase domain-containing protein [Bacteroidota bacterium]
MKRGEGEGITATQAGSREVRDGLRKRLFAWSLAHADGAHQRAYGDHLRQLMGGIEGRAGQPPVVVEIGAGAGPTARYLPAGARWIAIEPNVHFESRLEEAAEARGLDLEWVGAVAEALPVEDGAADAVVSTLVLCSVDDVRQSLAEIRRVLRPGGRFVFVEHVAADPGTLLRGVQRALRQPWGWIADGCRPDQDTEQSIREAGFSDVQVQRVRVPAGIVAPHIVGVATA